MNAIAEIAQADTENSCATRYAVMYQAFLSSCITLVELNRICYADLERQRQRGILRDDRLVPEKIKGDPQRERDRRYAIDANRSDARWLDELGNIRKEEGFTLSEKEKPWFEYVANGTTDSIIEHFQAEYLTETSKVIQMPKADDIPF